MALWSSSVVACLVLVLASCAHAARVASHLRVVAADHARAVKEDPLSNEAANASLAGNITLADMDAEVGTASSASSGSWVTLYEAGGGGVQLNEADFNRAFQQAGSGIIRRECSGCASSHQNIYIKVAQPNSWNAYQELLVTWTANGHKTKFNLYSSLSDALAGRNAWTFCNGGDRNIGFPRDCGPTGSTPWQWNSLKRGGQRRYKYSVYKSSGGSSAATTVTLTLSHVVSDGMDNAPVEVEQVTGTTIKAFTNRDHSVLDDLESLYGSMYIRGDVHKGDGDQAFTVNVPVRVIVAVDGRKYVNPDKQAPEGFIKTGESITWHPDPNNHYRRHPLPLYAKNFDAGSVRFNFRNPPATAASIFVMKVGDASSTYSGSWKTLYEAGGKKLNEADFNRVFQRAGSGIIRRKCSGCASSHKNIYIKVAQPSRWNAYKELLVTWTASGFKTKFNLYSSLSDALAGRNAWNFCNGGDRNIGFPRDCGPTQSTPGQWNSLRRGGQFHYKYSVYKTSGGSSAATTVPEEPTPDSEFCAYYPYLRFELPDPVIHSNLCSKGPDSGSEGLVYKTVMGQGAGREFDREVYLVVNATSSDDGTPCDYHPFAASLNGMHGKYGSININSGSKLNLEYHFYDRAEFDRNGLKAKRLSMPEFAITFFDLDTFKNGNSAEYVELSGFESYHLTDNTEVQVEKGRLGRTRFKASTYGNGNDNPKDPMYLTHQQRNRAVTLLYKDIHRLQVVLGATSGTGPRFFTFVGRPSLLCAQTVQEGPIKSPEKGDGKGKVEADDRGGA